MKKWDLLSLITSVNYRSKIKRGSFYSRRLAGRFGSYWFVIIGDIIREVVV